MPHEKRIAEIEHSIDKVTASIGTFTRIDADLKAVRKSMAVSESKTRITEMIRLNEDVVGSLRRTLILHERELQKAKKEAG